MFERYTDRSRRVVVLAQEEARALGIPSIGTNAILLGLLGEAQSVAAIALGDFGLHIETVRQTVRPGGEPHALGHIPFTPEAKQVLEQSLREALQLGHNYIGPEHILLGIVKTKNEASELLASLGLGLDEIRQRVIELLAGPKYEPVTTALLTDLELKVLDYLRQAVDAFALLPEMHPTDEREFVHEMHLLQGRIMRRAAVRAYPGLFTPLQPKGNLR